MFVVSIESRDAQILLPFIQKYIALGSIIHTDCWKVYGQIDPIYQHKTVNHSHFFYPDTGIHIQNIEHLWRDICGIIPRYDRKQFHFVHYLAEFMFKMHVQKSFDIRWLDAFFNVKGSTYKRRNSDKFFALKTQKLYKILYKKIFCAVKARNLFY